MILRIWLLILFIHTPMLSAGNDYLVFFARLNPSTTTFVGHESEDTIFTIPQAGGHSVRHLSTQRVRGILYIDEDTDDLVFWQRTTDNAGKQISFQRNVVAPLKQQRPSDLEYEMARIYLLSFTEALKHHIGYTQGFDISRIEEAFNELNKPRLSTNATTLFPTSTQDTPDDALKSLRILSKQYTRQQAQQSIKWISAELGIIGCTIAGIAFLKHAYTKKQSAKAKV